MPESSSLDRRFEEFITALESRIGHVDRHQPLRSYCTGLLLPGDRKSVEPMAARIDPAHVRQRHQSMHHFIADAPWSDREVLRAIRRYALPRIEEVGPIEAWIVDDTGVPKKGKHSVGVARQYCGQLGKTENCQVTVTLSLANTHASLPVCFRLYLPEKWAEDSDLRQRVGIPPEVVFRTKPQIALEQIQSMLDDGVPHGVVLADAGYGNDHTFREAVTKRGLLYGVGIQATTTVWPEGTGPLPPPGRSGKPGKPGILLRRDAAHQPPTVKAVALALPAEAWSPVRWRQGTTQSLQSRFAAVRVRVAHRDYWRAAVREQEWLLIEWPEDATEPSTYWLLTLPPETSLRRLVHTVKLRWRVERDYEEMKQEVGLGHYEGRGWRGFHHHWTMSIAAYAFLAAERCLFPPDEDKVRLSFQKPAVPRGFRKRGSPVAA